MHYYKDMPESLSISLSPAHTPLLFNFHAKCRYSLADPFDVQSYTSCVFDAQKSNICCRSCAPRRWLNFDWTTLVQCLGWLVRTKYANYILRCASEQSKTVPSAIAIVIISIRYAFEMFPAEYASSTSDNGRAHGRDAMPSPIACEKFVGFKRAPQGHDRR